MQAADYERPLLVPISLGINGQWENLITETEGFLDYPGLDKLKRRLGSCVQTVFIEHHYVDKDYRNTFSNFHSKKFNTPNARCLRLHFFNRPVTIKELRENAAGDAYIGYSVVRPTRPNCLGRTMLNPARIPGVTGTMSICTEKVTLQGSILEPKGFPYITQDGDVTVCAHSAIWMLLRFFSNRYKIYHETYPYDIGELASHSSLGRVFPSNGLTDWQMADVFRGLGYGPLVYVKGHGTYPEKDFTHLIYTYIESGVPVLASVPSHSFALFGHHSDYTKKLPEGEFVMSSYFNEAFVISDDIEIPYQLLHQNGPKDAKAKNPIDSSYTFDSIEVFTAPLPERVFLAAEEFEEVAKKLLRHADFGYAKNSPLLSGQQLILRIFLTTCRAFKRQLSQRSVGHSDVKEIYFNLPMPHFIWVCELSTATHYPQQEVLGEILWDATRNPADANGWIAVHYPEVIFVDSGSALNSFPDISKLTLSQSTPYKLHTGNLQTI